jgi:hypothetical protein
LLARQLIACPRHFDDVTWGGFVQPSFQLLQESLALRLARLVSLGIARLFHVALDAVELVDKSQCHLRSADLALGLSFLMNLRRACPATYTLDAFLPPGGAAAPPGYG